MIITTDDYHHDERAKWLADELLRRAGLAPFDVYQIEGDGGEGVVYFKRYRVAEARMINGKPVHTFKLGADGMPERYISVWLGDRLETYPPTHELSEPWGTARTFR